MAQIEPEAAIASVTLTDHLARLLTAKGVLDHGEREILFKNAIGFLRSSTDPQVRESANILEGFWERGWEPDVPT